MDNQGALVLVQNPAYHDRTKHIDIQHPWIREVLSAEAVELCHMNTEDQVADIFTKPLTREKFGGFRHGLGMRGGLNCGAVVICILFSPPPFRPP